MNLQRIRADTPAVEGQSFLHSAGSSLMPRSVVDAMTDRIRLEEQLGGYAAADREQARLDAVYDSVAGLLNAAPDEIALVENATVGWQMAKRSAESAIDPATVVRKAGARHAVSPAVSRNCRRSAGTAITLRELAAQSYWSSL